MIVIRTPGKLLEKLGLQPARVPIPAQAVRAHNLTQRPVREYSDSRRRVVGHLLLLLLPENPCCLGSSTVPINLRGDGPSKLVLLLRSPPVFSSTPRPGFYVALVSLGGASWDIFFFFFFPRTLAVSVHRLCRSTFVATGQASLCCCSVRRRSFLQLHDRVSM